MIFEDGRVGRRSRDRIMHQPIGALAILYALHRQGTRKQAHYLTATCTERKGETRARGGNGFVLMLRLGGEEKTELKTIPKTNEKRCERNIKQLNELQAVGKWACILIQYAPISIPRTRFLNMHRCLGTNIKMQHRAIHFYIHKAACCTTD